MKLRKPLILLLSLFMAPCFASSKTGPSFERLQELGGPGPDRATVESVPVVTSAQRTDEQRVETVCDSPERLLVLDNFVEEGKVPPYVDVDGDGKPDVATGDAIAAVYRASGHRVAQLSLWGDGSVGHIADLVSSVADKVEQGGLRLSAVMLSQSIEVPLEAVGRDLHLSVKPGEFRAKRQTVNDALIKMMEQNDSPEYGQLSRAVERLAARGVPFIVAAGNGGPEKVNLLGFLPGAISVGGLLLDGTKSPTSGDNSLVAVWRPGQIVLRPTADGNVDVNADGVGDFDRSKLTGEPSIASRFNGKRVSEAVINTPSGGDFDILSRETPGGIARLIEEMPDKLYRTKDLIRFFHREDQPYSRLIYKQAPFYDKTMTFPFHADKHGNVVFDPAGDGSSDQVGLLSGAAFAAASICRTR